MNISNLSNSACRLYLHLLVNPKQPLNDSGIKARSAILIAQRELALAGIVDIIRNGRTINVVLKGAQPVERTPEPEMAFPIEEQEELDLDVEAHEIDTLPEGGQLTDKSSLSSIKRQRGIAFLRSAYRESYPGLAGERPLTVEMATAFLATNAKCSDIWTTMVEISTREGVKNPPAYILSLLKKKNEKPNAPAFFKTEGDAREWQQENDPLLIQAKKIQQSGLKLKAVRPRYQEAVYEEAEA